MTLTQTQEKAADVQCQWTSSKSASASMDHTETTYSTMWIFRFKNGPGAREKVSSVITAELKTIQRLMFRFIHCDSAAAGCGFGEET